MTKIVYNNCFGGFGVSEKAMLRYAELKGIKLYPERSTKYGILDMTTYWTVPPEQRAGVLLGDAFYEATQEQRIVSNEMYSRYTLCSRDFERDDPVFAQVVEELGKEASGQFAALEVAEVPTGIKYRIDEYDGIERVMTIDDYEWKTA